MSLLVSGAANLGLDLGLRERAAFDDYCRLLLEANQRTNLTGIRTGEGIMRTLFLDSLTLGPVVQRFRETRDREFPTLADIGSGAGFPGLPLHIVYGWPATLIESNGKKAVFLRRISEVLVLPRITVLSRRAEEVGSEPMLRGSFDLVVSRAVASLSVLVELAAPLAKLNGLLLFPKSGTLLTEIQAATAACRTLRIEPVAVEQIPETLGVGTERSIVVYRKTGPTPGGFPRRVGLAQSRPLAL